MGFCSGGILVSSGQWAVVAWVFLGFCSDGSVCVTQVLREKERKALCVEPVLREKESKKKDCWKT